MGESSGNSIYYDRKLNIPVEATKHPLLDAEKTQKNPRQIAMGISIVTILGSLGVGTFFLNMLFGQQKYTALHETIFIYWNLIVAVCFPMFLNWVLYKNVKYVKPTKIRHLKIAIETSSFWKGSVKEKVLIRYKVVWIITIIVLISILLICYIY